MKEFFRKDFSVPYSCLLKVFYSLIQKIHCRHRFKQATRLQLEKTAKIGRRTKGHISWKLCTARDLNCGTEGYQKCFTIPYRLLFWNSFVQRLASWTFCYFQRSNASFERIRKSIKVRRWRYDWCPWTKTIHWTVYLHCIIIVKFTTWK